MANATGQGTATTSASLAVSGDQNAPSTARLRNTGSVDLYWGYTSGVTSATGDLVKAGEFETVPLDPGDTVYVITASGSTTYSYARARDYTRAG